MATSMMHDRPHAPAHHKPAPHRPVPHHTAPTPKGGSGRVMLILAAVALAGAGAWIALGPKGDGLTPEERLVKQMADAAAGTVVANHTFGGELTAARGERGLTVTARNVPSKACVSAAWRLAREGTVIVNGTLPMRVSAGRLTELCADTGNTLTWSPDQQ